MNTVIMKVSDLKPAKYNPRVTLESGEREYESLKKSLNKFGTVVPIIVNQRNNVVVGGHQRLNVLKELGKEDVEVVLVDLDEKDEKRLNLALNKVDGRWDYQKLDEIIHGMTDAELEFTGFINSKIAEADFKDVATTIKDVSEPKTTEKKAEFEIFVSFDSKDTGDRWLERMGFLQRFEENDSIVIEMGGEKKNG